MDTLPEELILEILEKCESVANYSSTKISNRKYFPKYCYYEGDSFAFIETTIRCYSSITLNYINKISRLEIYKIDNVIIKCGKSVYLSKCSFVTIYGHYCYMYKCHNCIANTDKGEQVLCEGCQTPSYKNRNNFNIIH
jgi:hypothetical protein